MADSVSNLLASLPLLVMTRYFDFAAGSLVVFDSLLTLDLEVKYIWQSKLSVMKVMYIVNRYTTIIDLIITCILQTTTRVTYCFGLMRAECVMYILGIYFAEYIFTVRTYIICGQRKIFWIPVGIFGVGSLLWNFISNFKFLTPENVQFFTSPPFNGCLATALPANAFIGTMFLTIYDAGMLILIGLVAFRAWRSDFRVRADLYKVLYGEGVLFYVYLLAFSIAAQVTVSGPNPFLFIFMGRCVRSILASRVILHLREEGDLQKNTTILLLGNTIPG